MCATSGFPGGTSGTDTACQYRRPKETQVGSLGREDSLEEGMATHSRILAWRIPRTEEPGGLQSRHKLSDTTERGHMHGQLHGAVSAEPKQRWTD